MFKVWLHGKKFAWLLAFVVCSVSAGAQVEFAYTAGADINSAVLWRGIYNGGLSFQPGVEIGYEGQHTSLTVGAWGSFGASDWKFQTGLPQTEEYNPNTHFVPEVDFYAKFRAFGLEVGTMFYEYFGSWQWEVNAGYFFEDLLNIPLYVQWNTFIMASMDEYLKQDYASYLEIGYTQALPKDFSIGGAIGISPWANYMYHNETFTVVNLSLRLDKTWEVGPCEFDLFALGMLNPDGIHRDPTSWYVHAAGDDKLYSQTLNGTIGLGIWF